MNVSRASAVIVVPPAIPNFLSERCTHVYRVVYEKVAGWFYCFGPGRERPGLSNARFRSRFVQRLNAKFMRDPVAGITLSEFIVAGTVNFNCSWQLVAQPAEYRCRDPPLSQLFRSSIRERVATRLINAGIRVS